MYRNYVIMWMSLKKIVDSSINYLDFAKHTLINVIFNTFYKTTCTEQVIPKTKTSKY